MSKTKSKTKRGRGHAPLTFQRRHREALADGTVGYSMLPDRVDDCLRAAVATLLQVDPREVPDPQLERRLSAGDDPDRINTESWIRLLEWLDSRGQHLLHHKQPPTGLPRWIGVCEPTRTGQDRDRAVAAAFSRAERRAIAGNTISNRFLGHCLVMSCDAVLFDPAASNDVYSDKSARAPRLSAGAPGFTARAWAAGDVTYGLSIEPKGT